MLGEEICNSIINEPGRWKQRTYTIEQDDGLEVWVDSTWESVFIFAPERIMFPKEWKRKIWEAIETRQSRMTLADLMKKSNG